MQKKNIKHILSLICLLTLVGCSTVDGWLGDDETVVLEGDRVSILRAVTDIEADPRLAEIPVVLPRDFKNTSWPQSGGYSYHAMYHVTLDGTLEQKNTLDFGAAAGADRRILNPPVSSENYLFMIDAKSEVTAFDLETGREKWNVDLLPDDEDVPVATGGLAVEGDVVYATTGFAQVVAMNEQTGEILWRRNISGPARAAPTVNDGRVFVVTVENKVIALNAKDGTLIWIHEGIFETTGLLGAASPAVMGNIVIVPYTSGEIYALKVENGRRLWFENLAAARRVNALAKIADIRALPVIDRDRVIVASHSGRMASLDLRTGGRVWEVPIASVQTPWAAGDFLFTVTTDHQLLAITRNHGLVKWKTNLNPQTDYDKEELKTIRWYGPVVGSEQIFVINSKGDLLVLSPYDGHLIRKIELDEPISVPPVIVNNKLLVTTDNAEIIILQ